MRQYPFLDGVRALAALFVFGYHAYYLQFEWTGIALYKWGYEAVTTFIVLSGFCLGLQLSKPISFWSYIGRRSRRLLPPYYAALGLLCCLLLLRAKMSGIDLRLTLTDLAPYLLMLKELFYEQSEWLIGAGVFWTIGIEYRCYWLLPLMARCFRKRGFWGLGASAIACYGLAALTLAALRLPTGHAWFILSFAMGVAASQPIGLATPIKYPASLLATLFLTIKSGAEETDLYQAATELLFGVIVALMLVAMAQRVQAGRHHAAIALLSHPLLHWFATWSYSLYLMHYALLIYADRWLGWHHITAWSAIALETIPILALCYLFSLAFERPFAQRRTA